MTYVIYQAEFQSIPPYTADELTILVFIGAQDLVVENSVMPAAKTGKDIAIASTYLTISYRRCEYFHLLEAELLCAWFSVYGIGFISTPQPAFFQSVFFVRIYYYLVNSQPGEVCI